MAGQSAYLRLSLTQTNLPPRVTWWPTVLLHIHDDFVACRNQGLNGGPNRARRGVPTSVKPSDRYLLRGGGRLDDGGGHGYRAAGAILAVDVAEE